MFLVLGWPWWPPGGLVIAGGVEGGLAQDLAGGAVDDADLEIVDQE